MTLKTHNHPPPQANLQPLIFTSKEFLATDLERWAPTQLMKVNV